MPRLRRNGPSDNTILVVDDQEDALGATQALLEREGHRVLPCATGAEALTRLAATDVQLVLVDYCMPTMSGPELIAAIRERDEFVQIVMQTGFAGPKPPRTLLAGSPVVLALANTLLVFLVVPLRARSQALVDRWFFRQPYDASEALSELSGALATVESMEAVLRATEATLGTTLAPTGVDVRLRERDGRFAQAGVTTPTADVTLPADFVERLAAGAVIARYEWDDGSGRPLPPAWDELGAELLVPIRDARGLAGLLVLGGRRSGVAYAAPDVAFLRTVASQMALAIEDVRLLQRLEQKQASLMRADRLATLGRLTSGLAHAMGSPIGAVLSSLRVLDQLSHEYEASIDEPTVSRDDHREIAAEMITMARNATEWAERASAFLKRITNQSRDPHSQARQRFLVSSVVAETTALLGHRLRAAKARVDVEEDPPSLAVVGDPASLGQVLTNLIGNALDAYEDAGADDRRLHVRIRREGRQVVLTVRDWAGGMMPEVLARIFDELYTTKAVGRGTGLGLWISRNLVEQCFGGSLRAESEPGVGSCFVVTLTGVEHDRHGGVAADVPRVHADETARVDYEVGEARE